MSKNNEQTIERIIGLMKTDRSTDAPEDAVRWAKNIFLSRAVEPKTSVARRILAVLRADLAPNRAAFGERSASAGQARQMFFQAGESAIDLRVKAERNESFSLRGQILGEDFGGATVKVGAFETTVRELGEFHLTAIPGGTYDLILLKGER